jgi:hypothetical protein
VRAVWKNGVLNAPWRQARAGRQTLILSSAKIRLGPLTLMAAGLIGANAAAAAGWRAPTVKK